MISLSSGLLQFASSPLLVTPDRSGSSASIDQSSMQPLTFGNQQQGGSSGQSVSSTTTSAQSSEDTYSPSASSQAATGSSTSTGVSFSTGALADLIKNQTISSSADVRQVLLAAIESNSSSDPQPAASPSDTGEVPTFSTLVKWASSNLANELQKVGYTAGNAAAEANAIMLGLIADETVTVNGSPISDDSQTNQLLTDLAKAATNPSAGGATSNSSLMMTVMRSMAHQNSATDLESTLAGLDAQYGTKAQIAARTAHATAM
jgi:hypothetical protein